ncbi:MAG TPA: DUF3300 domain-containing protein [Candidatus Acidoferrales bacterium]|nr:DUF3300 domain-containing protein [Candidatus Acidoferrales bacterium]
MAPGAAPGAASAEQLQELVSPIALYPDVLVAQILAGSTYPDQVVEADRWLKQNPNLSGDALAAKVNPQPWDPSIKSLTQFPTVLDTMNQSLAWTSELGEAYYNQPADVMNAIQVLRNKAMSAGTLKTTPQQKVEVQPAPPPAPGSTQPSVQQTVIIQPSQPNTVYVPQYNPTTAYGAPVAAPAGYTGSDLLLTGVLSFGAGILLGSLINDGHNDWGCGWGGSSSSVVYKNKVYVTNNNVYPGRYPGGGGYRPPYGGYPPPRAPGYRPPNAGGYPRPVPYPATRPAYNPASPNARPYDKASARPINPNFAKAEIPKFPKASTLPGEGNPAKPNFPKAAALPNNPAPGAGTMRPGNDARPMPNQPATRPANGLPKNDIGASRPSGNGMTRDRSTDPTRGFGQTGQKQIARGDRSGAFGGYEPGGAAQRNSNRGQGSFKGGGGGGNRAGGGNRNRGEGGGGRKGR